MASFDIFNAPKSVIANGLEGKIILIYGSNSLGKTTQAVRFPKPFVMACEWGMNGIDGIPYAPITRWSEFKSIIKQFTGSQKARAKEMYETIIVDEVYASSIYCQDYVCSTYGDGALTLADGDSKHNLYQAYEKEYFRQINLLVNSGYTVVFIAHQQVNTQTGYISPKGDKRCMNPIIDKCDYVVYLKSNGVDENGRVVKSSGYLAETKDFFARARIEYTPTFLREFSAESLTEAIQIGIQKKKELDNATVTTFDEQQKLNEVKELDFKTLMSEFEQMVGSIAGSKDTIGATPEGLNFKRNIAPQISKICENYLGKGKKISNCTEHQVEALSLINEDLKELIASLESK